MDLWCSLVLLLVLIMLLFCNRLMMLVYKVYGILRLHCAFCFNYMCPAWYNLLLHVFCGWLQCLPFLSFRGWNLLFPVHHVSTWFEMSSFEEPITINMPPCVTVLVLVMLKFLIQFAQTIIPYKSNAFHWRFWCFAFYFCILFLFC